jgi:hypothetical protein
LDVKPRTKNISLTPKLDALASFQDVTFAYTNCQEAVIFLSIQEKFSRSATKARQNWYAAPDFCGRIHIGEEKIISSSRGSSSSADGSEPSKAAQLNEEAAQYGDCPIRGGLATENAVFRLSLPPGAASPPSILSGSAPARPTANRVRDVRIVGSVLSGDRFFEKALVSNSSG